MGDFELIYLIRQKDAEAEQFMLLKHEGMIHSIIEKLTRVKTKVDEKDLVSIGQFALLKAIDLFDENRDVKFTTFAWIIIYRDILKEVKKYRISSKNAINNTLPLEYCNDLTSDENQIPDRVCEDVEEYDVFCSSLRKKTSEFEYYVYLQYISGCSLKEISQNTKKTSKQIQNALTRIKNKMKNRK